MGLGPFFRGKYTFLEVFFWASEALCRKAYVESWSLTNNAIHW